MTYRESNFYTPEELSAIEVEAYEALDKARGARNEATRLSLQEDRICKRFGWMFLASLGATLLNAMAQPSLCDAWLFALVVLVSAVMMAMSFMRSVRAEIARANAERAWCVVYRAWHRAWSRASCERIAADSGGRGRCGCVDCEADPLGFFGPYRKAAEL